MTFKHKMSRIVIGVTNESGFDITDIVIKGAVGTGVLDPPRAILRLRRVSKHPT